MFRSCPQGGRWNKLSRIFHALTSERTMAALAREGASPWQGRRDADRLPLPGATPHVLVSAGELKARVRARAAALLLDWNGPLRDGLRGCRLSPLLASLRRDSSTSRRRVDAEMDAILHTILGRRLTPYVVGHHPRRHSLTDFCEGA